MRIAILGGTGKEGRGLALGWAKAGHEVVIGSRDRARALAAAAELSSLAGRPLEGADNAGAARQAEFAVLSVPYAAHASALRELAPALRDRVLVDVTVPLVPPRIRRVELPAGRAAALEAQAILGEQTPVVATLHHVAAARLGETNHAVECDALVCSDDRAALDKVLALVADLGLRALDAGPLVNAIALESLVPVLLHLNKRYKTSTAGVRFTGIS